MRRPVTREIPAPAAGAGTTFTLSETDSVLLQSLTFKVVTNAEAAERFVHVTVKDYNGLEAFTQSATSVALAASGTAHYSFARSGSATTGPISGTSQRAFVSLPEVWLHPQDTVSIGIDGIKGGDQISEVVARYLTREHWLELEQERQLATALAS